MRATVMYAAHDVRVQNVPDARILDPTDALVRVTRACICGSDLWPYNSMEPNTDGRRMGHEFVGRVEDVGSEVRTVKKVTWSWRRLPGPMAPASSARWDFNLVHPRRLLGWQQARRRPGRSRARAAGRWHAGGPAGRRGSRAHALAADLDRRHGHRASRGPRSARRARQDCRGRRRWRSRFMRRDRRPPPGCGSNHHPGSSSGPDRAGT